MKHFFYHILFFALVFPTTEIKAQSSNLQLIKEYMLVHEMSVEDVSGLKIQRASFSKSMKLTNVYVIQEYNTIPIYNAIGNFAIRDGKIISFSEKFHTHLSKKIATTTPHLKPIDAIKAIATNLGLQTSQTLKVLTKEKNGDMTLSDKNISQEEIPVKLTYVSKEGQLLLCWDISIYTTDGAHWHSIRVDAVTGQIIDRTDWMMHCSFEENNSYRKKDIANDIQTSSFGFKNERNLLMEGTYNVFPIPSVESPNHGSRVLVSNPANALASPFGWHDTDGISGIEFTTTRGNNVLASEDTDADNIAGNQADGGTGLVFDFPLDQSAIVENFEEASITNLFYANNIVHDVWYQYGFDESAGNFQFNNYGKGGIGSDEVFADTQDGLGFNNANFGTPPDGSNPRMQMFLWNPVSDPSIDTFVVNNGTLTGASYATIDNSFNPGGHVDAPLFPDGLTADLVLVTDMMSTTSTDPNDACDTILNAAALVGKIAVVKRGSCNFDDKVLRCQQSGAIAVLVVNNQPGAPTSMGGNNALITIPAIMIGLEDGEALISAMTSNTINATMSDVGRNFFAEDSSFDNGIVIHEYGHGISTRLTGGADNSGCLRVCAEFDSEGNCIQFTEQMGEGWSDWFALMMTIETGDTGPDSRGIGTYSINEPVTGNGIRPSPYSIDMAINSVTYKDTNNQTVFNAPHGVGSVWASMLWDLTWAFIDRDGFDPDIYNGTGGNNLAMQLIIDGLKLQSCNPGFIDGRDAILAADEAANSGNNACLIWEVFSRRGLGWSASQGDSMSRADQIEAFDIPPSSELQCLLNVEDFDKDIFRITPNPSSGSFVINISRGLGETTIRIVDMNGRIVFDEDIFLNGSHSINANNLRTGIYLLQIMTREGNNRFTTKIVIE